MSTRLWYQNFRLSSPKRRCISTVDCTLFLSSSNICSLTSLLFLDIFLTIFYIDFRLFKLFIYDATRMEVMSSKCNGERKVEISRLKEFAARRLPRDSLLRRLILIEPSRIDPPEFLGKLETWLNLFDLEIGAEADGGGRKTTALSSSEQSGG